MNMRSKINLLANTLISFSLLFAVAAQAKDLEYNGEELTIRVNPNEPSEIRFPGNIAGGFVRKNSGITIEKKANSLVLFANDSVSEAGQAMLVRLDDQRSFSLRIRRATQEEPREPIISISDSRAGAIVSSVDEEEEPAYKEKRFDYAPPTQVSGLMREMALITEFGKQGIPGYQVSNEHKGEVVINDGTLKATVEQVVLGPNLWGYVIKAENLLDVSQKINPAAFRIDGTRAVSAQSWELAAKPITAENQLAGKHVTNIYVVARARK